MPRTKLKDVAGGGEDVFWAAQNGVSGPVAALAAHFRLNDAPPSAALFAYWHYPNTGARKRRPLTCNAFKSRIDAACIQLQVTPPNGHGLRIGGTLELLLCGVDFEVVKNKGRWKGDSFQLYLRRHGAIMAPYVQAQPALQDRVVRYTMPRVC